MNLQRQKWDGWIDTIKSAGLNLTDWEKKFVDDIDIRLRTSRYYELSQKQEQILERIYAERTP